VAKVEMQIEFDAYSRLIPVRSYHPKPRMYVNLLTSIRFQKNLRTSPEKLTYDNFVDVAGSKVYVMCHCLITEWVAQ